jgi:hypothetical protein
VLQIQHLLCPAVAPLVLCDPLPVIAKLDHA